MNLFAPIAVWGFWMLLVVGYMVDELSVKAAAVLAMMWLVGFFTSRASPYGALFVPYAAALDIALVFIVFKGDVQLK